MRMRINPDLKFNLICPWLITPKVIISLYRKQYLIIEALFDIDILLPEIPHSIQVYQILCLRLLRIIVSEIIPKDILIIQAEISGWSCFVCHFESEAYNSSIIILTEIDCPRNYVLINALNILHELQFSPFWFMNFLCWLLRRKL